MAEQVSVGLCVSTILKGKKVVVLQRRGVFNPETMRRHSWPGVCQVLVSGKKNEGESDNDALVRESHEEIGYNASVELFSRKSQDSDSFSLVHVEQGGERIFRIYAVHMPDPSFLKKIRLYPGTGGLVLVSADTISDSGIETVGDDSSRYTLILGVADLWTIAMFQDELLAITKVLLA